MSPFDRASPALAAALDKRGYTAFTPVQSAVLNEQLRSQDLLVSAQTGSGKTVAFGLAIAGSMLGDDDRVAKSAAPLALVIAPTRELALQVKRELEWLYAETGALVSSCVGGMDPRTERRALARGVQIVVGTPGCWIGKADWDAVALVEYPRKEALLEMIAMPEYQAIHHHREAGLEGQVNYAVEQTQR